MIACYSHCVYLPPCNNCMLFTHRVYLTVFKAHRVINLEMAKILNEKGFIDRLPGQKLCRQCVTKYEKLTKPPENENMTEIIETENS